MPVILINLTIQIFQMYISFIQKENKTSDVEYEDDVINEVPSCQHNISIDQPQSV